MARTRSRRYPLILLCVWLAFATLLAFDVHDRSDWALENALAVVAVGILVATNRNFPLSKFSYTCLFVFLCLHEIGAHYTYSKVPYDDVFAYFTGLGLNERLGWERNHYDRVIHFTYGLLVAYPIRELVVRVAQVRGFWGYFFPLDVIASTSMLYELIEWCAAMVVGSNLGNAYLGTQGDEWDAQKDMLLATLGALIALTVVGLVHRSLARDFHREWAESLRVKQKAPLGEVELEKLRAQQ